MKTALIVLGSFMLFIGLLWVGQGEGLIDWRAASFMIDQRHWATRGAIVAVLGLLLILISRARKH